VAGLPFVLVYRMNGLSFQLARRLVRVPHAGLPNLVAGHELVPELIQGRCRPERIADEVLALLGDVERRAAMLTGLAEVRSRLGGDGAFDRAAEAVLAEIDAARGV